MLQLTVSDMTCGHCVSTITKALKQADPQARVEIELKTQRVSVESTLEAGDILESVKEAGYTPVVQA